MEQKDKSKDFVMEEHSRLPHPVLVILLALSLMLTFEHITYAEESTPVTSVDQFARSFLFHPADGEMLSTFDVSINPGEATDLTIFIGNSGSIVQTLRVYPVNVFTGEAGGMVAANYGDDLNTVSKWVELSEEIITLEPGFGQERTFTVRVPEGTPPGEYIAAVAGEHVDAFEVERSENFRQRTRFVTPIYITVPGEMTPSFRFGDPTLEIADEVLLINIPVVNDGDMHVSPSGEVVLRNLDGQILVTIPISLKTIFARETTAFTLGVTGGLEEGEYQLEGSFVDAETGASASITKSTFTASAMTPREPDQFTFALATATPGPSEDDAQFATIESTIRNIGDPATGVQLSLIAMLDGEEVERFPISQSLSLPTGETPITTRYVPATGFTTGTWSFELVLETVSGSGAAVVVARAAIEETVVIP